ncbi:hypothetical protein [[Collinsella] massiliensis]|uniref:hypothetical protein n=1 Tax=[Collinsella] massiliensis TaxID=1232426 RepID=UPI00118093FB|nr:hypothetical protein [[Collinsella] massiliensis]
MTTIDSYEGALCFRERKAQVVGEIFKDNQFDIAIFGYVVCHERLVKLGDLGYRIEESLAVGKVGPGDMLALKSEKDGIA